METRFEKWLDNEFYNNKLELTFNEMDNIKQASRNLTIDKEVLKEVLLKHFVHGYKQGLGGAVHSKNCRLCKVLKELGLEEK